MIALEAGPAISFSLHHPNSVDWLKKAEAVNSSDHALRFVTVHRLELGPEVHAEAK